MGHMSNWIYIIFRGSGAGLIPQFDPQFGPGFAGVEGAKLRMSVVLGKGDQCSVGTGLSHTTGAKFCAVDQAF